MKVIIKNLNKYKKYGFDEQVIESLIDLPYALDIDKRLEINRTIDHHYMHKINYNIFIYLQRKYMLLNILPTNSVYF